MGEQDRSRWERTGGLASLHNTGMLGGGPNELPTFVTGDVLGERYAILRFIAQGGMGEVYEAEDLELGARVALKTVRPEIARNERSLELFKREILLARMVTHPNVCRIFDLGRHEMVGAGGVSGRPVTFLTMELLAGETLAQRLLRAGAFSTTEALPLVAQMVAALSAAHRAGIVHRDFKSANVMLVPGPEGTAPRVVVTDFGLARSNTEADISPAVSTASGFVMGTPAYIAPEQVEGGEITGAADIYALGVVLFEMMTGATPFTGETPLAVVVKRLKEPAPSPRIAVPDLDPRWEAGILRCLERDPAARFAAVDDLVSALRGQEVAPPRLASPAPLPSSAPLRKRPPGWMLGALALLVLAAVLALFLASKRGAAPAAVPGARVATATQLTSSAGLDLHPAFSPDGLRIAYSSDRAGTFEVRVATLGAGGTDMPLTTDGRQNVQPAFSPDGQWVAYHSKEGGGLWVIPAAGGTARQISTFGSRPVWSPGGAFIAFQSEALVDLAPNAASAMPPSTLWIVGREGGTPRPVTTGGSPAGGHGAPAWSSDERRLVFTASDRRSSLLWSVSLDGGELFRLASTGTYVYDPVYAPDGGHVFYSALSERGHYGMWALPVGPDGRAAGDPQRVADLGLGASRHLALSRDGKRLAYSALQMTSNLRQVDPKKGAAALPPLTAETGRNARPIFSPDGAWLAFERWRTGANPDVWLMRPDGTGALAVATDAGIDTVPSWLPEGKALAYRSDRSGRPALWKYDLSTRRESMVFEPTQDMDWVRVSPRGTEVAFNSSRGGGTANVWLADLSGANARQITFDSEFMGFPCWSPDGRFLALQVKRGESTQVAVVPREGGTPVILTRALGQAWPYSFSPDGDRVAFAGLRDGYWNVHAVSRRTGLEERLTTFSRLNTYVRYPAWSPRGDRLAFEYAETSGNVWSLELP